MGIHNRGLVTFGFGLAFLLGGCGEQDSDPGHASPESLTALRSAATQAASDRIPAPARGRSTQATIDPAPSIAPPTSQCSDVDTDTGQSHIPAELLDLQTTATTIEVGEFTVDYARYPLPYPEGFPWSHWGKGRFASNGRFYSAVGDHGAQGSCKGSHSDGNTFLYEYDPATKVLRAVGDAITAYGEHQPGQNGYGKIHGQIDEGPCGMLYMHTYWGSAQCVTYSDAYRGDLLLRYNTWNQQLESLGSPMPGRGTPSTNMWEAGGLLYGEANVPDRNDTKFWVWDTQTQTLIYQEPEGTDRHNRNIAVDLQGRAYFDDGKTGLRRYDPASNEVEQLSIDFDAGGTDEFLRASTERVADGTITLVTENNTDAAGNRARRYSEFYHFDPETGRLDWLAHDDRYVGDVEADPTGRVVYYTAGAHEQANDFEVIELDRATGERRTLVRVGEAIRDAGGPQPGGSFSVNISSDGKTLYFASNSTLRPPGLPMIVVVHIPPSEMP